MLRQRSDKPLLEADSEFFKSIIAVDPTKQET